MRLVQARVQNYRCVRDTGWFDIEEAKTILVGPNEAGKTAVLEALQQINPSDGAKGLDPSTDHLWTFGQAVIWPSAAGRQWHDHGEDHLRHEL